MRNQKAKTQTVRVSSRTHEELREIAQAVGESMQTVIEQAVEDLRRKLFFEETNEAYMALRSDPNAWAEIEEERALWDQTLADGLDR